MVGYWLYKFVVEDRDLGVVDYEVFEKASVDFPVSSVCVKNPFMKKKLKEYNSTIDTAKYVKFLKGESLDDDFISIDYLNSTIDMGDYLTGVSVKLSNDSKMLPITSGFWQKTIFNGFITNGHFVKCFEMGVEKERYPDLQQVTYDYQTFNLQQDLGFSPGQKKRIYLNTHYTGQFLLQPNAMRNSELQFGIASYTALVIKSVEFLRRRKNRNHDCFLDWDYYDQSVLNKHIETQGCVAPYHRPMEKVPMCSNYTELKKYYYDLHLARNNYLSKACQRLSKLNYEMQGQVINNGWYWKLVLMYPEEIKIIQQYKEVDGHVLMGNIGGYIGLFLGKSLINLRIEFISRKHKNS